MAIIFADEASILRAVEALKKGACIGLPTETVYGLAADGLHAEAVAKIFEIKGRPTFDPLILHVPIGYDVEKIGEPNEVFHRLKKSFWPGPLTLILPKKNIVPDLATSGLPTVAVRCPNHPIAQEVLKKFGSPLAAPSANRFGRITPTSAQAVYEELGDAVEIILDAGASPIGLESTIVDCTPASPLILRQGAATIEELRQVCPEIRLATKLQKGQAPGTLENHYAPRTPLYLCATPLHTCKHLPEEYAYLFWQKTSMPAPKNYRRLSPTGSLREAAVNLFQHLRELDALSCKKIIVDPLPLEGLGAAIADRLKRASTGEWKCERENSVFRVFRG
ncbi:MAG: L-threonylcarbamoyladenylate synthase [Verrucomicrobiota bacterium]